jgi:hypothetical protein
VKCSQSKASLFPPIVYRPTNKLPDTAINPHTTLEKHWLEKEIEG